MKRNQIDYWELLMKNWYGDPPQWVKTLSRTYLIVRVSNILEETQDLKVTQQDVAEFYDTQAMNMMSGARTLAGWTGDWRPVSELAQFCLDWFKLVDIKGMRRVSRKRGLVPKF